MAGKKKKSTGKSERQMVIFVELAVGRCLKKADLVNRYEISKKTVQRDVSDIRVCLANLAVQQNIFLSLDYDLKKKGYRLMGLDGRGAGELLSKKEMMAVSKAISASDDLSKEEKRKILHKVVYSCVPEERDRIWKWILGELL